MDWLRAGPTCPRLRTHLGWKHATGDHTGKWWSGVSDSLTRVSRLWGARYSRRRLVLDHLCRLGNFLSCLWRPFIGAIVYRRRSASQRTFIEGRVLSHQQCPEVHQRPPDLAFENLDLVLQGVYPCVFIRHDESLCPEVVFGNRPRWWIPGIRISPPRSVRVRRPLTVLAGPGRNLPCRPVYLAYHRPHDLQVAR